MIAWNVVVTIQEHGFNQARDFLQKFGKLNKTEYFNVLVIQVGEIGAFLETVKSAISERPAILECIARIMPVTNVFKFQTPLEFEEKAKVIVLRWLTELAGKRFHVRMHRRGFKGQLSSQIEERFLDSVILKSLVQQSQAAPIIDFDDPDYIIAVETVGQIAGFALWSREQLQRYPFLKID
jgi:tRNA(Ser,Leu) C12 N-acetylase TAN1